ncbi:MAG: protein kinase [Sandaracinus sp.]
MSDTPARIGPYAIERRLGAGGMAETFVAVRRMQTIEQRVCLKRILPAYARDATARRLFAREANLSAKLRHANLVQVLDVGEDQGVPYLVMELVEGCDLDHVIERAEGKRLAPELVGYVLAEIAHGLHEAHGGDGAHDGVVHRDLSPSNVLLSTSGEVKVADFGIAKALSGGEKATATMMRGKFAYMAPEQLDGAAPSPRADLFALGVIGYEMLAGVRPFEADADARLVLLIAKNERRSLYELAPTAPRALVDTIEALLAHDQRQRPQNGHDVVERLAPMLASPVVARRQLGKLVTAAYEARLEELARAPTAFVATGTPPVASVPAMPAASTPITRPAATPVAASQSDASNDPVTQRDAAPVVARARETSPVLLMAAGVAIVAVVAAGAGGLWLAFGGSGTAAGDVTTPPPTSVVALPPSTVAPPSTAPAVPPPTTLTGAAALVVPPPSSAPDVSSVPVSPPPSAASRPPPTARAPSSTTTHESPRHGADPPPSSAAASTDETPRGSEGRIHVVVSPWGNVWIDGRFMGRAPVEASLRAGSHRIQAGFAEPTTSRTIRVRAGGDERVEMSAE